MKHFLISFLSVIISSYFIYHGIYGHRGILRLNQVRQEYVMASQKNEALQEKVSELRLKVEAMTHQSRDLIEEEMMRVLNMGNPDDIIVLEDD